MRVGPKFFHLITEYFPTWALNAEKSTQPQGGGGGQRISGGNFVATQEANLLTVASTRQGPDGEVKSTLVYDKK